VGFFSNKDDEQQDSIPSKNHGSIKAVVFDVFGTVVDLRGSLLSELNKLFQSKGLKTIDCDEFAHQLITFYSQSMNGISEGKESFALVDDLNKIAVKKTLQQYQLSHLFTDEEQERMGTIWQRLNPWPDSVAGIDQLKKQFTVGPLSNGNIHLLETLAKNAKLDWDVILSGEMFHCYKPNPLVYQKAAELLNLNPSEILLVAAHEYDLIAAAKCGYKTAFINRSKDEESEKKNQHLEHQTFDYAVTRIDELAAILSDEILTNKEKISIY
jgi:2-haloacid dehalogenase